MQHFSLRIPSRPILAALLVAVPSALTPAAGAQSKTDKHPELGLTVTRPLDYEPVPLPPGTEYTVLRYVWHDAEAPTDGLAPTLLVHIVERPAADAEPTAVYDTESFVRQAAHLRALLEHVP